MNRKEKSGISLIVLVITIIVIIILAGSVILSLSSNNPIAQSREATFKTNVGEYNSELALVLSNKYLLFTPFDTSTFDADIWDGISTTSETVKEYITSMTLADAKKFVIQNSKLVYVGSDSLEKNWLIQVGVGTPLGINVIATENATVNAQPPSYNNPIIPKGFKAVDDGAIWPTDWNLGLVIEDVAGNQFVWVPVDGTNVKYEKWCTTGISFMSTTDDTLPTGFSETNITTKYKGFYIARYEAMFDYNGGSIRAASKKSINKITSYWHTTRNATYNGYLWNCVNYTDSKTYAQNMATSYGYDLTKVGTNLITGTQWDTAMKWIQNSIPTINVTTDSRAWGNYSNSVAPANVENGILQISGYSNNWKAKNIYDLAGNAGEWTNENYSSNRVIRSSSYNNSGNPIAAAYRSYDGGTYIGSVSFRTVLYIL